MVSLDVFILTFNAAKEKVDPAAFAHHLRNAFTHNSTSLPELVIICLQEVAPLANAFIGTYMTSPYFQAFESAVNLAARSLVEEQDGDGQAVGPYTLVTMRNAGMTGIMLLSLHPDALHKLQSAEVSFGAGDMAIKGAVGLRMLLTKDDAQGKTRHTELTFVSTHLAAMEWNLEKRNRNWETLVSGMLFEDPGKLQLSDSDEETGALLPQRTRDEALHDMTIYKPGSHLFVAGDLNYRISRTPPTADSEFPDLDPDSPNYFPRFLAHDQLMSEKANGRTLHGLSEADITFPPTYKLVVTEDEPEAAQAQQTGVPAVDVVPWKWASHRWPGWCDRILFLDIPRWASRSTDRTHIKMTTIAYDALPPVRTSDHRAVFLRLSVPVLEPSVLSPPDEARAANSTDPRIRLPYAVDLRAWERRSHSRTWEHMVGWSMLVCQSKQGMAVFVTLAVAALGTWWLRSR